MPELPDPSSVSQLEVIQDGPKRVPAPVRPDLRMTFPYHGLSNWLCIWKLQNLKMESVRAVYRSYNATWISSAVDTWTVEWAVLYRRCLLCLRLL